jgi:hypothetical protein
MACYSDDFIFFTKYPGGQIKINYIGCYTAYVRRGKMCTKKKNMEVTTLETLASKERVVYVLNKALHHEDIVEKVYRSTFS